MSVVAQSGHDAPEYHLSCNTSDDEDPPEIFGSGFQPIYDKDDIAELLESSRSHVP